MMDPQIATQLAPEATAGGVPAGVVYILALFMISVVIYLLKEHVTTHKTMILVLQENNVERRNMRRFMRKYFRASPLQSVSRNPGTPRLGPHADAAVIKNSVHEVAS